MKTYHKNPRTIKDKQFNDLRAWLLELGDLSGIVHDLNTDEVISGNQRMRAIDIAKCEIVLMEGPHDPDAQGTVAHGYVIWQGAKYNYRQVRWTAEQCEKANIVANKAGGSWDFDILANEWEKDDLLEWGFELEELGMLPDDDKPEDPGAQIDKAEELREKWGVETGQLWQLGKHRLICGDCTDAAIVARVMGGEKAALLWADPPFGIEYTGHGASVDGRANKFAPIMGDDKPRGEWLRFAVPINGGAIYLKSTWMVLHEWELILSGVADLKSRIVWDKCSHVAGDVLGGYATQSEIVLFATIGRHKTNKFDSDVWRIPRATTGSPEQRTGHPYESPIDLPSRAIENSSQHGEIVLDPFLGSGTTMVAAQRLGRRCFGIEIDPGYAAVTLQRMSDMGLTPELVVNSVETVQNAT